MKSGSGPDPTFYNVEFYKPLTAPHMRLGFFAVLVPRKVQQSCRVMLYYRVNDPMLHPIYDTHLKQPYLSHAWRSELDIMHSHVMVIINNQLATSWTHLQYRTVAATIQPIRGGNLH